MHREKGLWEKLISDENLRRAMLEVNSTHRTVRCRGPNRTVKWVEETFDERREELRRIIEEGFEPGEPRIRTIYDRSAGKERQVCEPPLWPDQYVHHAFVQVLEPRVMRSLDPMACASIRSRGISYGMRAIKKWMRRDLKGTAWCMELDIKRFYESIRPEEVVKALRSVARDRRFIDLAERITRGGVAIGAYPSQWFANLLLTPLDHAIRESGLGVAHYIRHMDNLTLFASAKRKLKKARKLIEDWLSARGLRLKETGQIFRTRHRLPTALGYRYGRGFTLLRKRNLLRLKRALAEYYRRLRRGRLVTAKRAAGLLSRLGQLRHCSHVSIYRGILKRERTQKSLKDIIRRETRWRLSRKTA